jgi:hypothetical protein
MTAIPESEKIYPVDTCPKCGGKLIICQTSGDEDDDYGYISCENAEEEADGHFQAGAIRNALLKSWGWKI